MAVTKMVWWTISILAAALLSVIGVQQLIKRLHYGSDDGRFSFGVGEFISRYLPISFWIKWK